ncbi:hypothetical protein HYH02_012124 [Chlamydomonas schloesseri]|uniref:Peptidase M14 domain-containing protein n=1 Tax=Chlamydomonas schloesseri TaxID=2026947 RepID=A0A835T074_9CHLO|nr:hypothetical protein HYH02_012124 [Chlamydomonas schloesseri]|eukprot:KAG2434926.1 hypothetical protein HYH02_012124 [Chlamydomonas schloesseri]
MVSLLHDVVNNSDGACTLDELDPPSVGGRVLYAVVAAPRPPAAAAAGALPRPSFTWIGNMHGDETANKELLLRLAAGLCSGELADNDARWKALQASTTIRIIPTMNPDGFERRTRWNANKVDLNRNFWSSEFPYAKPTPEQARKRDRYGAIMYPAADMWSKVGNFSLQPEAVAVSRYLAAAPPDLSANLHGGALVANYPLDACDSVGVQTSCPSAEEPVPRQLAAAYAAHNPDMTEQSAAPFAAGTVQGAAWYPVLGSLQDWVYHRLGRLMLTLELHEVKDPPAAALDGLWGANSVAFLRLMELAGMGLRGRVLDQTTRAPLAATLTVTSPASSRPTVADARRGGYFYKPLAPGVSYDITVQPYAASGSGTIKYLPIQLVGLRLGMSADRVTAEGSAVGGTSLRLERTLLATRAPANKKKKMLRASA